MLRDDLAVFGGIRWRVMVVDEAQRVKNKDSALATELRTLRVEHTLLMTGTPLQVRCTSRALHAVT